MGLFTSDHFWPWVADWYRGKKNPKIHLNITNIPWLD